MLSTESVSLDRVQELLSNEAGGTADRSLRRFREAVGGTPDLTRRDHVVAARVWLNAWGCRIAYPRPDDDDVLVPALGAWWAAWSGRLPPLERVLVELTDADLDDLAGAHEQLAAAPASYRGGRLRRVCPTAASKLLYALRPAAVTPWDQAISARPGVAGDFRSHLDDARVIALALRDEATERHVSDVAAYLGRPESSLAKIVDEVLYLTITRRR